VDVIARSESKCLCNIRIFQIARARAQWKNLERHEIIEMMRSRTSRVPDARRGRHCRPARSPNTGLTVGGTFRANFSDFAVPCRTSQGRNRRQNFGFRRKGMRVRRHRAV